MISILLTAAVTITSADNPAWSNLDICAPGQRNTPTKTCIVDGDTLWLTGTKYRLKDVDTPEPNRGNSLCEGGGTETELELSAAATWRLQDLVNSNTWIGYTGGPDSTPQQRTLLTIEIDGVK